MKSKLKLNKEALPFFIEDRSNETKNNEKILELTGENENLGTKKHFHKITITSDPFIPPSKKIWKNRLYKIKTRCRWGCSNCPKKEKKEKEKQKKHSFGGMGK